MKISGSDGNIINTDSIALSTDDPELVTLYMGLKNSEVLDNQIKSGFEAIAGKQAEVDRSISVQGNLENLHDRIEKGELPDAPQNVINWMKEKGINTNLQEDIDHIKSLKIEKSETEQKLQQYNKELEELRKDLDSLKKDQSAAMDDQSRVEISAKIASKEAEISTREAEVSGLKQKLSNLENEIKDRVSDLLAGLEKGISEINKHMEHTINAIKEALRDIKGLIGEHKEVLSESLNIYEKQIKQGEQKVMDQAEAREKDFQFFREQDKIRTQEKLKELNKLEEKVDELQGKT